MLRIEFEQTLAQNEQTGKTYLTSVISHILYYKES